MKNETTILPVAEPMAVAQRAYVCKAEVKPIKARKKSLRRKPPIPSDWVLIFDTETTTDASQQLRFGTYQVRKKSELEDAGVFYDEDVLSKKELTLLKIYAAQHDISVITVRQFIEEVFYGIGYSCRATIVGFNLPFDISRLAIGHASARTTAYNKIMAGGFSFKLSDIPDLPRVQIKHISSRDAFIQFASTRRQRTSRSNRKKQQYQPVRRGFFIDCKTLAAALTSQSHSLASLAQDLEVDAQKHATESHGQTLTSEYIDYAVQDTQTTWECFNKLKALYELHGLKLTAPHRIHSEASLGKAYLKEMGIQPWKKVQPDFPDELLGNIMSAYYGGRSEVHIRKVSTQVLYCDFLSMYPTVCTLMGLWRFVIAQGMTWDDSSSATQQLLNEITLTELQQQSTWSKLITLVQVLPEEDIFPVRAKYGGDAQYTIGSNYMTCETPVWYTLADCLASKILTGRAPHVVQAITFKPMAMQTELKPVCVAGNSAYSVSPSEGDFFKRVIDQRREVKAKIKMATQNEKSRLNNQQLALKILANATSYGIFVELNVEQDKQAQSLFCYGHSGNAIPLKKRKFEATGLFFHPLLAALITGAARLKLAITERLTQDAGLDWAFCDTDSMALAKPESMEQDEFYQRAKHVQEWFTPLNPYTEKSTLLKIEDYNYSLSDNEILQPLYCYAVSSKRYALYNLDQNNKPILRKVSAHGLGHLIAPYQKQGVNNLEEAQPWQQDLWQEIIEASLANRQPDYRKLPHFSMPAVSRYSATTPALLKWFDGYNKGKSYGDQVKPFNFLLAMQANPALTRPKPVAPFNKNPLKASIYCFDRETGDAVNKGQLKTYLEALAQYHLHPETKFLNGDYIDSGKTQRRHIFVNSIQHIGKEANKWEEQFYTGFDSGAQIEYRISPEEKEKNLAVVCDAIKECGIQRMAASAELSREYVSDIYHGAKNPSNKVLGKLIHGAKKLEENKEKECKRRTAIKKAIEGVIPPFSTEAKSRG